MTTPAFLTELARVINAGQSRSVVLAGDVHGLFPSHDEAGGYKTLIDTLCERFVVPGVVVLVYELNGPVRLVCRDGAEAGWGKLRRAWQSWKRGIDHDEWVLQSLTDPRLGGAEADGVEFDARVGEVVGRPTVALEFLRQLTLCSRSVSPSGAAYLDERLIVLVEAADLMLPTSGGGDIAQLNAADRHRVAICQDWFSDPGFVEANDAVVLVAESASLIHPRVAKLPQVVTVEVEPPDEAARHLYINRFIRQRPVKLWASFDDLARLTAGLSIHALRQLLVGAAHRNQTVQPADVIALVERHIQALLGEDVVEFKKPTHTLADVVGFTDLKRFIEAELLPRFRSTGPDALPGAAVAGPIGAGKTFIFEAVAASLGMPVLVLKNIRSQWFGQTDVVFERLRRVLLSLGQVMIFVDEADTQFGGVGAGSHETERRLTGKVQAMMSDPALRGRVVWLLMTARIERLSPDIRRPGRVGDLIIPVLHPAPGSSDRRDFLRFTVRGLLDHDPTDGDLDRLDAAIADASPAAFAALRSRLQGLASRNDGAPLTLDDIEAVAHDQLPPDIGPTRRYQTLQALVNCTRRSLLPDPDVTDDERQAWRDELRRLEAAGVA